MHSLHLWQQFRLPHSSFKKSRFQFDPAGSLSESFGRKTPTRFKAPVFQPVLACEPDFQWVDTEEVFSTARRLHQIGRAHV